MRKRVKALGRVQQLQKQLHDLSVWRLSLIDGRLASLEEARDDLIRANGSNPLYYGAMGALAARRLRAVEEEIQSVRESRRVQARHAFNQGGRLRLAERLLEKADADHRSHAERQQLSEIIDRAIQDRHSS
jgi:hypothetical protein